jgi:hypothetical protein
MVNKIEEPWDFLNFPPGKFPPFYDLLFTALAENFGKE